MIFPFMTPYLHMMRRNKISPWGTDDQPGQQYGTDSDPFGQRPWSLDRSDGNDPNDRAYDDKLSRRRGIYSGLTALGASLLEAAPKGDFMGGIARGAAGFADAYASTRQRDRQIALEDAAERRRAAAEQREIEQERDRNESHDINVAQSRDQHGAWKEDRDRDTAKRQSTAKSAEQMVAEIESLASRNPNDPKLQDMARRARGYAQGEFSDVERLTTLHEDLVGQAYRDEDVDWKTGAEIRSKKAAIDAGVENDPKADDARAARALALDEQRLGLERQRLDQRRQGNVTSVQRFDRVERLKKDKLKMKVDAAREEGRVVLPGTLLKWEAEARREAEAEVDASLYNFDADGTLLGYE